MNFIYFQFFIIIFSTLKESFVIGSVRYLSADSITGESSNLRDANKTNPSYSGSCFKREKDNKVALDEMKKSGVTFLKFSENDIKKGNQLRKKIIDRLLGEGTLFSKGALTKLETEIKKN